jgi:hypothetical protein
MVHIWYTYFMVHIFSHVLSRVSEKFAVYDAEIRGSRTIEAIKTINSSFINEKCTEYTA